MQRYLALLEPAAEGEFGVVFPDLPGCTSHGVSYQQALANAADALAGYAAVAEEQGERLPEPRTPADIIRDGDTDWYSLAGRLTALVPLIPEAESRAVRVSVTFEPSLLSAIDAESKVRGMTRAGFLAAAARRLLLEP